LRSRGSSCTWSWPLPPCRIPRNDLARLCGAQSADDQPSNVEGAKAVGLADIVFDICRPAASFAKVERRFAI